MQASIFETPRLRLCELQRDDAPFLLELLNEPAFLQYIGDKQVRSIEDVYRYLEEGPRASYEAHGFGLWRVDLVSDGTPIGICGLLKRPFLPHADLGYALLQRYWSRGFALEAARATLQYARTQLKLTTLFAMTALENPASIRILETLGFRFDRIENFPGYATASRVFKWEEAE
jgi:RimJ/RimL family protein N-acetyltransferase